MECNLCGTYLESSTTWSQHINGKKHLAAVRSAGPDYVQQVWGGAALAAAPVAKKLSPEPTPSHGMVPAPRSRVGGRDPETKPIGILLRDAGLTAQHSPQPISSVTVSAQPSAPAPPAQSSKLFVVVSPVERVSGSDSWTATWKVYKSTYAVFKPKTVHPIGSPRSLAKEAYDALATGLQISTDAEDNIAEITATGPIDIIRQLESLIESLVAFDETEANKPAAPLPPLRGIWAS